jgi:F-type H+-transporting ATPase subunit b
MKRVTCNNEMRKSLLVAGFTVLLLVLLVALGFANEGGEGAHHVDSGKQMKDFMWRCIDFAALAGIIFWAVKKADVKKSLGDRQEAIARALKEAEEARTAAEKKFAEYNQKLAAASVEMDELQAAMKAEGALEKERIIAEAKVAAERIKEQAQVAANQEILKARMELRAEASRLAVTLAEQTLKEKIVQDDQNRLVGEYLTKVVELH